MLTPLFAYQLDTKTAVVIVSLPHAVGTALRLWLLRRHIDRRVLASFGVASVVGGLAGAALQAYASTNTSSWP